MASIKRQTGNLGQIIEYIPDRLYLASYLHAPDEDTLFPYPEPPSRSPHKRSQRSALASPVKEPSRYKQPYYFSVDDSLLYNAFHHDFGPFHIGHLYRFALQFHEILAAKENKERPVVFWSRADPRSRANAFCLLSCYMVLIQSWPPHLALAPIAQCDPPLMPFRDAGYSQADYGITVQDVVYGVWKAKEESCCALETFDLDEYERYERVEQGDFNWVTPHFLAFASPQSNPIERITETSELFSTLPRTLDMVDANQALSQPFKNVLRHFKERSIGLVVRLNSQLYSPSYFEALGIQHLDMIFEDGTCPPLSTVRKFIRLAHDMITVRKKGIAVHCKAGLGRTGCLIGAYLIYRHGFTANEVIAYMRFMRPGMVVGPQQHWLHLNQGTFREWWIEERMERRLRKELAAATPAPSTPIRAMQKATLGRSNSKTSTPPHRNVSNRTPLSEMDNDRQHAVQSHDDYLPAPTPGQPRKATRHHPYSRDSKRTSSGSEETLTTEVQVDSYAVSPMGKRSVSHTTMSTTTTTKSAASYYVIDNDASNDAENIGHSTKSKLLRESPHRSASASGVLTKVRGGAGGSVRRNGADSPLKPKDSAGVRKTSGRVGSMSASVAAAAAASGAPLPTAANVARKMSSVQQAS